MAEELQKDPMTRGQFLWMGALGTGMGIVLTVPPAIYVLDPSIDHVIREQSDVPDEWVELGSVFEIPSDRAVVNLAEFTQKQTYDAGQPGAEIGEPEKAPPNTTILTSAVLVSWKDGKLPDILENRSEQEPFSKTEIKELTQKINVMSNACAHMGCPVRWSAEEKEIVCPCHGGIYSINGEHEGGPPPHGLWRYAFEIREDGSIYIKHEFPGEGEPYVV